MSILNFKIGKVKISNDGPALIIPEVGINHNGSFKNAKLLVDSAFKAGAKIIKHQTHIPEDEMSYHAKKIKPGNSNRNIFSIIENSCLTEIEEFNLKKYVEKKGMEYLSTPFSIKAVDRLVKMKVKAFKIGSGECNNIDFVEYIAKKGKPIILSTGMNSLKTIEPSVKILKKYKLPFVLLHCTSIYPAPDNLLNLNAMNFLRKNFKCLVGYSDHSKGLNAANTAMALGASVVEKHYVHSKKTIGPDVVCSMDSKDLKSLIISSPKIFYSLGKFKGPLKEEYKTIRFAFSSVVAKKNIKKGEKFTIDNLVYKRPGTGEIPSCNIKKLFGLKSKKNLKIDEQLKKKYIKK